MAMYKYVKSKPKRSIRRPIIVSFVLIGIGGAILGWVSWPIIAFSLFSAPLLSTIVSPLQERQLTYGTTLTSQVMAADGVKNDSNPADLTHADMWFPTKPQKKVVTPVNTYRLSIPKLTVKEAMVTIAGDDLNHSLVHYGGTGLPGQFGNAVIFGHSVLPQFFNPKNYMTIFSTLPTLKEGDDIFITYDSVTYKYKVESMIVKDPADLSVLEQQYDDSYITLVTCVPPGTYWKRLNVRARLVKV